MIEQGAVAVVEPELTHRVVRERTAACHQQLDKLLSNELDLYTPAGYRAFLTLMLRARCRYGATLATAATHAKLPDTNSLLCQALREDLAVLAGDAAVQISSRVDPEFRQSGVSEAAGVLYVFEGAALGARFVLKRIQAGPFAKLQLAYLSCLAGRSASRWRAVTHYLDTAVLDKCQLVAAANDVFATLIEDARFAARGSLNGAQK